MNPMREYVEKTYSSIRQTVVESAFDCRPQMIRYVDPDPEFEWNTTEEFLKSYTQVKHSVAKVLQPKRICEIGVYRGIAALAFCAACPGVEYVGIDSGYSDQVLGYPILPRTMEVLRNLGYNATLIQKDTMAMDSLEGLYDLVHVDGCHTREAAKNDVKLAFNSLNQTGWIMVDDCTDCHVVSGTFDALLELPGGNVYWSCIDGVTGSILIQRTRQ